MKLKFYGTFDKLMVLVASTGLTGEWHSDGSKHVFRTPEGGVLNYWLNGTYLFQGKADAQATLERELKHLLTSESGKGNVGMDNTDIIPIAKVTKKPDVSSKSHISTLGVYCFIDYSQLKHVKAALSDAGLTIMSACGPACTSDSVSIVTEVEYDFWRERSCECNSEIFIQKL